MKSTYFNLSKIFKPQWSIGQGELYGLNLDWKYHNIYVDLVMPGSVKKVFQKFQHQPPKSPQFSPFSTVKYVKSIKGKSQYAPSVHFCSVFWFSFQ